MLQRKRSTRTTATQKRIDNLYRRYGNYLIIASDLLKGLALVVGKKKWLSTNINHLLLNYLMKFFTCLSCSFY